MRNEKKIDEFMIMLANEVKITQFEKNVKESSPTSEIYEKINGLSDAQKKLRKFGIRNRLKNAHTQIYKF